MSIRGPPPAKQTAAAPKKWGTSPTSTPAVTKSPFVSSTTTPKTSTPTPAAAPKKWGTVVTNTPTYSTPKQPSTTAIPAAAPKKFGATASSPGHGSQPSLPTYTSQSAPRAGLTTTMSNSSPSLLSSPTSNTTRPYSTTTAQTPSPSLYASSPRPISSAPSTTASSSEPQSSYGGFSSSPTSSTFSQPTINYTSASTGIKLSSDLDQQLTIAYQTCAKPASPSASIGDKIRAIFAASDERAVGNALYITQNFLDQGQGVQLITAFLREKSEEVVVNACKALTNFAQKGPFLPFYFKSLYLILCIRCSY